MATKKQRAAAIARALKKPSLSGYAYLGGAVILPALNVFSKAGTAAKIKEAQWAWFGILPGTPFFSMKTAARLAQTYLAPAVPAIAIKVTNKIAGNVVSRALSGTPARS